MLDDDTVREWFGVYQRQGMAGWRNFGHEGSSCQLTDERRVQQARRQGKFLPPEVLLLIAENSLAMAARYQPELTNRETGEKQP